MMRRRTLLTGAAAGLLAPSLLEPSPLGTSQAEEAGTSTLEVGVIGHTGRGNFGHGLDTVWLRLPRTRIAAVADADPQGLQAAKQRLGVDRAYADYRLMLAETRPQLVAVCPRQPDQHRDMILASVAAGARGIYVEKPFCRTPAEADEIVAACEKQNVKLAVAHRNRYHPVLQTIDRMLADGVIGKLLEIRGRGKGDRRGGAEDLWVLGSHVLNLMQYFGGQPQSCSAVVRQDGRPVTRADVREGAEALGPLAGNEVHARYQFSRGPIGYFDSIANDGTQSAGFGLQLVGSQGLIDINCDRHPLAYLVAGNPFRPSDQPRVWSAISTAGPGRPEPNSELHDLISHHVTSARDLVAAIDQNRQPLCSALEGAMTVEMICAVFASHQQGGRRVTFPLETRTNALLDL